MPDMHLMRFELNELISVDGLFPNTFLFHVRP
jgi:hypothetical protein